MLLCKAQVQEIIWRFGEEEPGRHAAGCYQEGGYAHKRVRTAPAPELLLGFHLGHSFTLLVAEQQRRKRVKVPEIGKWGGRGREETNSCASSQPQNVREECNVALYQVLSAVMSDQRSSACCKPISGLLVSSKPFTSLPVNRQVKWQ